jgi:hypothetical protein
MKQLSYPGGKDFTKLGGGWGGGGKIIKGVKDIFPILKRWLIYLDRKGRGPHILTHLTWILPPPSWDRQALPATQRKKEQERAKVANQTDRDSQGGRGFDPTYGRQKKTVAFYEYEIVAYTE